MILRALYWLSTIPNRLTARSHARTVDMTALEARYSRSIEAFEEKLLSMREAKAAVAALPRVVSNAMKEDQDQAQLRASMLGLIEKSQTKAAAEKGGDQ